MTRWGHFIQALASWIKRHGVEVEDLSPMEAAIARDLAEGQFKAGSIYVVPPLFPQRQPKEIQ